MHYSGSTSGPPPEGYSSVTVGKSEEKVYFVDFSEDYKRCLRLARERMEDEEQLTVFEQKEMEWVETLRKNRSKPLGEKLRQLKVSTYTVGENQLEISHFQFSLFIFLFVIEFSLQMSIIDFASIMLRNETFLVIFTHCVKDVVLSRLENSLLGPSPEKFFCDTRQFSRECIREKNFSLSFCTLRKKIFFGVLLAFSNGSFCSS